MAVANRDIADFAAVSTSRLIGGARAARAFVYHLFLDARPARAQRRRGCSPRWFRRHHAPAELYNPDSAAVWNVQVNNVVWVWCTTFFLLSAAVHVESGDVSARRRDVILGARLVVLIAQRALWRVFSARLGKKVRCAGKVIVVGANRRLWMPPSPTACWLWFTTSWRMHFSAMLQRKAEQSLQTRLHSCAARIEEFSGRAQ